jgi:hypothetical protein
MPTWTSAGNLADGTKLTGDYLVRPLGAAQLLHTKGASARIPALQSMMPDVFASACCSSFRRSRCPSLSTRCVIARRRGGPTGVDLRLRSRARL